MKSYEEVVAWWQSHQLGSVKAIGSVLEEFNPCFALNSCLLDGLPADPATVEEFFKTGTVSQFSGNPRDLFPLYNQKFCYEFLRERVLARDDLDTALILETHRILTSGTYDEPLYLTQGERPGELKKRDYVTANTGVGAPARDVGQELDQLVEQISGYCGPDLLWAAAVFHCRFENIHPFAAGNGATGRVLVNFFLLTRDHPPLVFFAQDREAYLRCLTAYDREKDPRPLASFLEEELLKTWQPSLEKGR